MPLRRGQTQVPAMRAALVLGVALAPAAALAHGPPATPDTPPWRAWNWDPLTLGPLLLVAWLYARGVTRLWRRAGRRVIRPWRAACFAGGCATVFAALVSPLDALAHALFSVHMIQHMLIMGVAAPLLVLGRPPITLLWALPFRLRVLLGSATRNAVFAAVARALARPGAAWTIHFVVLWAWHAPTLYDAAVRSAPLHWLEHLTMLIAACLFWQALIQGGRVRDGGYGVSALAALTTLAHAGMLGALLTFAPEPLYESHLMSAPAWGLTPLEDQQLAGLVMWVPACLVYLVAGVWFIALALTEVERRETGPPRPSLTTAATHGRKELG